MGRISAFSALYALLCLWINILAGNCTYTDTSESDVTSWSAVQAHTDCPFIASSAMPDFAQTCSQTGGQKHAGSPVSVPLRSGTVRVLSRKTPAIRIPVEYYVHFLRRMII